MDPQKGSQGPAQLCPWGTSRGAAQRSPHERAPLMGPLMGALLGPSHEAPYRPTPSGLIWASQ